MASNSYVTPWGNKSTQNKFLFAWDAALPATRNNSYLARKKIKPYGTKQQNENLLIPIYNKDRIICGLQTIAPDGTKHFEYESKIDGNYFALNEDSDNSVIYIAEGMATCASIAEATGAAVICAFSAGNLPAVAKNIRAQCQNAIVIAADNKSEAEKAFAEKAALACDGFVSLSDHKKDFNDMAVEGIDINEALSKIYKPEPRIEVVREYKDYSSYDETFDKETIQDMLSCISADIGYHEWIEIGMALKAGGASLGVWDEWSKSSAKYKKNGCYDHWNSFKGGAITIGTLVHHAQMNGWTRKYEASTHRKLASVDIGAIVENKRKIKPTLKIEIVEFDGLIGETVKWITDSATFKQPVLATLNVLATLGAAFGRKYRTSKLNTRTNIYTVGVAGTACHGKGTKILMSSGLLKNVEDIIIGDQLMGDDNTPRTVLKLARGNEEMYEISPLKGEPFIINAKHVLSLIHTRSKKIINISLDEYLKKGKKFKHLHKLRRCSVDFPSIPEPDLDAWFLGAMIGDGYFVQAPILTSADDEIAAKASEYVSSLGMEIRIRRLPNGNKATAYRFAHKNSGSIRPYNHIRVSMEKMGLWGKTAEHKFIPDQYKLGSRAIRMNMLAGLLDTDGSLDKYGYDFISKSKQLAHDVQFVARSLGYAAYVSKTIKSAQNGFTGIYWRVFLSGDFSELPIVCSRKKAPKRTCKKSVLVTGFNIRKLDVDEYYGFTVNRNHLYLTSDFMVHHNCGKDHSRKLLANLCNEAGLKNILGDNGVRSDSGIVKSLTAQASQVMMIDEFGDFLKGLKDQKAAAHIKAVGRLLLQLYSTSSSLYKHGTYATEKMESMILHCPNLCIYGTTTEDIYAAAISKEGIKSGELNRFIVLPGDDGAMPCHDIDDTTRIPQHLVDGWRALDAVQEGNNLAVSTSATFEPEPENVEWGECWKDACDLLDFQCKKRDEPNGALWGRYRENIIKIALIYCLSERKKIIEKKHIETARHYVDLSVQYMNKLANSHMADNQWEELHNEFVRLLEKNKGEMRKFELARAMKKVKRRDFEEMLGGMKEAEIISIESRNNNGNVGRPTVYVRLL